MTPAWALGERITDEKQTGHGHAGDGHRGVIGFASAIRQNIRVIAEGWETVVESLVETQGDEIRLRLSDNHYDVL